MSLMQRLLFLVAPKKDSFPSLHGLKGSDYSLSFVACSFLSSKFNLLIARVYI